MDALEFHVYLDPPPSETRAMALARCHAALVAINGRLTARLDGVIWQREPFELSLWDPAAHGDSRAEPHLWGRMSVGESVDDEWFAISLLLQLCAEQRDASVTVRDADGELLLIEAAHRLPRWFTPDVAPNRVFLRGGALHILPPPRNAGETRGVGCVGAALELGIALRALRGGCGEPTEHSAATEAVRRRADAACVGALRVPPRHHARCVLPLPVAQILAAEPTLIAAMGECFHTRDAAETRAAAHMRTFSPRAHPRVISRVGFNRCIYAQLHSQPFTPPAASALATSSRDGPAWLASAAEIGAKVAFGAEILWASRRDTCGGDGGGEASSAAPTDETTVAAQVRRRAARSHRS